MANRVTESEVKQLMKSALPEEDFTPYLCTANMMINGILAGSSYSEDELAVIELWLAAHFVTVRDPGVSREKIGETEVTYDGKTDMGLNQTRYGQQVIILAYKGEFAAAATSKGSAEMRVIG